MNSTIIILLLLVLLASLVLFIILLLDQRRNADQKIHEQKTSDKESTIDEKKDPISIHEACMTGNMRELNQWLTTGTDLNQQDDDGYTPLHHACENGFEDIVQKLLDNKAKVNSLTKASLLSPLACLVIGRIDNKMTESAFIKIIGILRKAGGEINRTTEEAVPPIKAVIARGNMELLDLFMSLHVHIFVEDSDKRNMLHHIALNPNENSLAITEFLIQRGLEINAQDSDGNTPLHLAISPYQKDVVKHLINSGADSEIKNWKGISPKSMVQQNLVNFLRQS